MKTERESGANTKKVQLKDYIRTARRKVQLKQENDDHAIDEMVMIIKIGNNYTDFKNCMEKYARDRWY